MPFIIAIVAAFAAALALVLLTPKPKVENARPGKLGDFQFPRAKYGDPIPLLWGTARLKGPIVSWYGDFQPVPIVQKQKSGMFGSTKQVIGYKNYMGIDLALCLGPSVRLRRIWADNKEIWSGDTAAGDITIDLPELFGGDKEGGGLAGTMSFYDGSFNPTQDAYLVGKIGANVPAYNGIARVVFKSFYIGTSTTPKAFNFELSRRTTGLHATYSLMPNGYDVNPMEIIYDAFTQRYGSFGNSASDLDLTSLINCAQILYNEGLGMSLCIQSAITGRDLFEEVMRIADGILYQDPATGKIVAKLIRNDYTIGSLLVIDESIASELRNFQKTTWESTLNQCRVSFKDRATGYEESVAITQDFANINFQNRVKSTEINVPGCTTASVASILASRQLSILNIPLYKCELTVNRKAQSLRPGDVFVLNWLPFEISNMVMRVTKIDLGDLTSNEIKISCIQDRFASSSVTFANSEASAWTAPTNDPQNVTTRLFFNPPAFLSFNDTSENLTTFNTNGRLQILSVPPSNSSISYDGYISTNNFINDSSLSIKDAPYSGGGILLNNYPSSSMAATSRTDTSSTLVVTGISQSTLNKLNNFSSFNQTTDGSCLILINDELINYLGFINNGGGQVTFPFVYRGLLDTIPGNHNAGDRVWFIDSSESLVPNLFPIGTQVYLKQLDKTIDKQLAETSATIVTNTVNDRAGLPLPPAFLQLNGSRTPATVTGATSVAVSWRNRTREDPSLKVYFQSTNVREPGTQTRVRWRVGTGAYTTVLTTGSSTTLNVTGLTGTLEVIVDSQIIANSKYSRVTDTLTMTLA